MPRNNKITEKVFASIAETGRQRGAYEKFLSMDKEMGLQESEILKRIKHDYRVLANDIAANIKVLAHLEEIIIQIRAKEVIDSELRLSLSRDYIYARSTFYRRTNQINDIRVVVGKVEDYGDDIESLFTDTNFRALCKEKLNEAMDKEIEINLTNLKLMYDEKTN